MEQESFPFAASKASIMLYSSLECWKPKKSSFWSCLLVGYPGKKHEFTCWASPGSHLGSHEQSLVEETVTDQEGKEIIHQSQTQRMFWIGRDLQVQPTSHVQGHVPLHQVAQSPTQPGLEQFHGWGIHSFSGQSFSVFHHTYHKNFFLIYNLNLPSFIYEERTWHVWAVNVLILFPMTNL